jgi:hypothetical protein
MKFNSTTDKDGMIQYCEVLLGMADTDISGDTTLLKQFTMLINTYYRQVNSWIWHATGTWEYDDSNYSNLPIATTNLGEDEQQDYEMPSDAQKVDRVEVLDSDGNYQDLKPFDKSQIKGSSMTEFLETAGMPRYYDLVGRSIFLYPKPSSDNVTLSRGLKVYISRDIAEFASSDTTTEPGFVENFHAILPLGASLDYCIAYMPDAVSKMNYIKSRLNDLKEELQNFYGSRHRDMKTKFIPKRRKYT